MEPTQDSRDFGGEPGIQIHPIVVIHKHAGIEGKFVTLAPPKQGTVGIMHMTIVRILSIRFIAHRHTDRAQKVIGVIQVVPAIGALRHIRCEQQAQAKLVHRVLILTEDHTGAGPGRQIADGR